MKNINQLNKLTISELGEKYNKVVAQQQDESARKLLKTRELQKQMEARKAKQAEEDERKRKADELQAEQEQEERDQLKQEIRAIYNSADIDDNSFPEEPRNTTVNNLYSSVSTQEFERILDGVNDIRELNDIRDKFKDEAD
jgi:hypothetical protein